MKVHQRAQWAAGVVGGDDTAEGDGVAVACGDVEG